MESQLTTSPPEALQGTRITGPSSRILRGVIAVVLMTTAANCFLKYVWWTACYSAWSGIPKLAEQWKAAGSRASFYGWSLLVLELASVLVISGFIRVRSAGFFRKGLRFAVSLTSTVAGTALFAWILSLVKQGIR